MIIFFVLMKLWHFLNSLMCLNVHMKVLTLLLYKEDFLKRLCVITSVWFNAWETENYFFILYWHTFIIFKGDSSFERKRRTNKIVWWKWWRSLSEIEVTIYWICEIHLCKLWLFKIDNFLFFVDKRNQSLCRRIEMLAPEINKVCS